MRVAITGANGLIGKAAVAEFARQGWDILGIGREVRPDGFDYDWIAGDLSEAVDPSVFEGVDAIVHMAAIPSPGAVSDPQLFRNNTGSTYNVLHAAGEAGVKRAVVASSVSIYGLVWAEAPIEPSAVPLTETSEIRPADTYALTKEVDEATARMMSRRFGMSTVALRLPNVSDEDTVHTRSHEVASDIAVAHRELWGYLTLQDAGNAIFLSATAPLSGAVVLNVVSPQALNDVNVPEAARQFYPAAEYRPRSGRAGYSIALAEELIGFRGTSVLTPRTSPSTQREATQ